MAVSGSNLNNFHGGTATPTTTPVIIMFEPTGRVSTVYINNTPQQPTGTIYLGIGRPDKVKPADPVGVDTNVFEQGGKWVTINSGSGLVSTADMVDVSAAANTVAARLPVSQNLARNAQNTGGG